MMQRFEDKVYIKQQAVFARRQIRQAKILMSRVMYSLFRIMAGEQSRYDYLLKNLL